MSSGLELFKLVVFKMFYAGGSLTATQRSVKEGRLLGRSVSHSSTTQLFRTRMLMQVSAPNPTMHFFLQIRQRKGNKVLGGFQRTNFMLYACSQGFVMPCQ